MNLSKEKLYELLENIKIVKITEVKKHEGADKLWITQVQATDGQHQIVTAATNMKEGDLVAWLAPGFVVPGFIIFNNEEITLTKRPMRGIDSEGMILAEDEFGLSHDHEGIYLVDGSDDLIGKSLVEVLSDRQKETIEKNAGIVEVTPEAQKKMDLITKDLGEAIGLEDMASILNERNLKIYWGTAPTGKPHLGYFVPLMKIADFLEAGCEVTILFADIHAYLDNMKSNWDILKFRIEYYEFIIKAILSLVGVPLDKLKFVRGSDYQLDKEYILDIYKVSAMATLRDVQKAGAEVVKQVESPLMSSMLYPILQALDEQFLQVDAQFGGMDQRKIFMFAREYLPKMGYEKRVHLMNVLIPGLGKSGKMSSSEPNSKIDLDDSDEIINDKISKAFSVDKQVEGNGLLAMLRYIVFRKLSSEDRSFVIEREEKWGGNVEYKDYAALEEDFKNGSISSVDLKPALAKEVINIVSPLRDQIKGNVELLNKAYP